MLTFAPEESENHTVRHKTALLSCSRVVPGTSPEADFYMFSLVLLLGRAEETQ